MKKIEEYLDRTKSAARKLFDETESYTRILRENPPSILVTDVPLDDIAEIKLLSRWYANNREGLERRHAVERKFIAESFALGVLCGSILQMAYMGIQLFSRNSGVPPEFDQIIKSGTKVARFCVGRRIRTVPIGLVIYAGRNQYNHMDDNSMREPNLSIFHRIATNWGDSGTRDIQDPAFDLSNTLIANFASNILALIEWKRYEDYCEDMFAMLADQRS
jgi:hypothetical protein